MPGEEHVVERMVKFRDELSYQCYAKSPFDLSLDASSFALPLCVLPLPPLLN